jgi:hypothetical protein
MHPCLSLSVTSQNHQHSFYASVTACTLSLSSQIASQCCVVPLPIHWHQLIVFVCREQEQGTRGERVTRRSRGPRRRLRALGEQGAACVEVESRGAMVQAEGARI